jgi:citrate synthase
MSGTTYPNYSPGLEGIVAGITTISEIDSNHSSLIFRGIHCHEMAGQGTYEETAYLLLYGKLPNVAELKAFKETLGAEREVPSAVYEALAALPKTTHPMDSIRAAYGVLAPHDADYGVNDHDANVRKAVRIIAKAGTMVANGWRLSQGQGIVKPDPTLSTAANFLYMLNGEKPDYQTERTFDSSLTLYAEHGFNASTFACRVTVSTLSDLYSGVISGIGALKGPLHGGANEEAMRMLLEIGEPENAEAWIRDALAQKKKVMGFGHREYKKGDSRAFYLSPMTKDLGRAKGITKWGDIADILEDVMLKEKNLYPNVDFVTGYLYYLLGIPIDLYTPIFVSARVAGWCAHAIEQLDHNRLIRPTVIYEGPHDVHLTPLSRRP